MNIYCLFDQIGVFFLFSIGILLFLYYILKSKKRKIYYGSFIAPHKDILTNDIINAFYISHIHCKNIKICLIKNSISILFDKNIEIKSIFNASLVKFLMYSSYTDFIFFITLEGVLEMIYFDMAEINNYYDNSVVLIINHCLETNLFDIKNGSILLKNNNTQKTIYIIKEVLKNNVV